MNKNTIHGHAQKFNMSPEYKAWADMKARCQRVNTSSYKNYGARGITVCPQWQDSFKTFLKDMNLRPSGNHSLERVNNDLDYTPENCRWATRQEQNSNKRRYRNNASGITGVGYDINRERWIARISNIRLYSGPDFFEACCARKSWEARALR